MTKEELIKHSRENLRKSKQGSLCECYDEAFIKGYELSEKRIEELEKENAELKELIKNIIRVTWGEGWNYSLDWKVKAEQFIRDSEAEK